MAGSRRSPAKCSAEPVRAGTPIWAIATAIGLGVAAHAQENAQQSTEPALRPYTVVGDAIPASLTGQKGDPARGRAIVGNRQVGLCLLCHNAPIPEEVLTVYNSDPKAVITVKADGRLFWYDREVKTDEEFVAAVKIILANIFPMRHES